MWDVAAARRIGLRRVAQPAGRRRGRLRSRGATSVVDRWVLGWKLRRMRSRRELRLRGLRIRWRPDVGWLRVRQSRRFRNEIRAWRLRHRHRNAWSGNRGACVIHAHPSGTRARTLEPSHVRRSCPCRGRTCQSRPRKLPMCRRPAAARCRHAATCQSQDTDPRREWSRHSYEPSTRAVNLRVTRVELRGRRAS